MKIEEAKQEVNDLSFCGKHPSVIKERVNRIIDQIELDQPKPVVPQFVADWYEEHKEYLESDIFDVIWIIKEIYAESEFEYWLNDNDDSIQTLINMHQFGYEIEYSYTVKKDKLYTVEIPNPNGTGVVLCKSITNKVGIRLVDGIVWKGQSNFQLTEQEIRKDFDWAFRWAEQVEEDQWKI